MHDLAFADSARPTRVVCLRLLLKPYALGHELLLWKQSNPLLISTREYFNSLPIKAQMMWLMRAVLVCYRDWDKNQHPDRWIRLWGWSNRNTDWPAAIAEFRNYLTEGRSFVPTLSSQVPEDVEAYEIANAGEKLEGGRALGSPMLAQLVNFASSLKLEAFGVSSIWDFPFSIAGNLYFAQLESAGAMHVENHREAEERATMANHRSAVEKEKAAARLAWKSSGSDEARMEAIKQHPRILDLFPDAEALQAKLSTLNPQPSID